jgi:hypothetical protein
MLMKVSRSIRNEVDEVELEDNTWDQLELLGDGWAGSPWAQGFANREWKRSTGVSSHLCSTP